MSGKENGGCSRTLILPTPASIVPSCSYSLLPLRWRLPGIPIHAIRFLVDASCARNGGLLHEEGKLFRVSQRQGFDRYKKGSQINEIIELSDVDYKEVCVAKIAPFFGNGLLGTHHLHSANNVTVFDSLARGPSQ